jgi:hypothetical protein
LTQGQRLRQPLLTDDLPGRGDDLGVVLRNRSGTSLPPGWRIVMLLIHLRPGKVAWASTTAC